MNLSEAYDYMDMLLDKADEPYFTTEEKNKFLNLAISEFINTHYQKMNIDEDSRKALAPCIKWTSFSLTKNEIASGNFIYANSYPGLSEKYKSDGMYDDTGTVISGSVHSSGFPSTTIGFFTFGFQYVPARAQLYVLSVVIVRYNYDDVIDKNTGELYSGLTVNDIEDIVVTKDQSGDLVKNENVRDFYSGIYGNDPFNTNKNGHDDKWTYIENRMLFSNPNNIRYINIQTIVLPEVEQVFSEDGVRGNINTLGLYRFSDHYQKQIIQMAIRKMSGNVESSDYQIKQIEAQL